MMQGTPIVLLIIDHRVQVGWGWFGTLVMFLLFALRVSQLFLFIFSSKVAYTSGPQVFVYLQLYLYAFLVCSSAEREGSIQERRRKGLSQVQNGALLQ